MNAEEIARLVQIQIEQWHIKNEGRPHDFDYITDEMRKIRAFGDHREDLSAVITELIVINTEMWHEQDKMRSERDEVVLRAIHRFNPLNQRRNDLIEEIDEIFLERAEAANSDADTRIISADETINLIQKAIAEWHEESTSPPADYVIISENIRKRRPSGIFRNDMAKIVKDLAMTHTESWHEEDKIHSGQDDIVIAAVRNANFLNRHRNDLVEELDEMFLNYVNEKKGDDANGNARQSDR